VDDVVNENMDPQPAYNQRATRTSKIRVVLRDHDLGGGRRVSIHTMRDQGQPSSLILAFLLTLLAVTPAVLAADLRLVEAARNQDQPGIRTLLNQHIDVNLRSEDGSTALLWAAHWNDLATAELLIRAGADANAANDFRMTPLSQACTNGSARFVELLLKARANPDTPIATGETPLMTCARTGSADAVAMLLAQGADVNGKEPTQNQTALMWAAAEQHPQVLQTLIAAHADLRAHTKRGFTALHFAARTGDLESTRILLDAGVDVNIRAQPDGGSGPERGRGVAAAGRGGVAGGTAAGAGGFGGDLTFPGSTPLFVATVRGHVPLALFLLDHGADPNVMDAGFTPLFWAAGRWENGLANPVYGFVDPIAGIPDREAKLKLVKGLLAHGADPNLQMTVRPPTFGGTGTGGYNDAVGATAFVVAANAADLEMMRLLLAAGANPHLVTKTNSNALLAATGLNRGIGEIVDNEDQALAAVTFLLDLGVEPRAVTTFNENALFGPAYRGWNRMLELLIAKGADVNVVSKAGVTPWLAASGFGDRLGGVLYNKVGADILLKHGADPKLGHPCQAQNRCRPQ
jgi:ankyrin repeat protein